MREAQCTSMHVTRGGFLLLLQVYKAMPTLDHGTYGLVEGAERGLKTDPVTGEQHLVGLSELRSMVSQSVALQERRWDQGALVLWLCTCSMLERS